MTALPNTPCQNAEMRKQDVAHQREMALNTLSEVANVFDFPDLNRFLTVSSSVHIVNVVEIFQFNVHSILYFSFSFFIFKESLQSTLRNV